MTLRSMTGRLLPLIIAFFLLRPQWVSAQGNDLIGQGDDFPEVAMPAPEDSGLRAYLGLSDRREFTLSEVAADVVLVEILNTLCPHCRRQSGPYNRLYQRIENDPDTRGRIRLLAVAVANSPEQVAHFVTTYRVSFPVIPDPDFTVHRAIGGSRTPFSIYVRQDRSGAPGVVTGTHLGLNRDTDKLFAELKGLLTRKAADFRVTAPPGAGAAVVVEPVLSPAELDEKIRATLARLGGEVTDVRKMALSSGREVYRGELRRDGRPQVYFAEVARRPSICDICHDVHFIYVVDGAGQIVAFEPILLTKWENARWSEEDIGQMRQRLLGQRLSGRWTFDPKVDAVSRATMTSAIIFDVIGQGEALLEELRAQGRME